MSRLSQSGAPVATLPAKIASVRVTLS